MKYSMNLREKPYQLMKSGEKTIELRLYDEKRSKLNINDEIEFTCIDSTEEPINVRVVGLHRFDSFEELYNVLPLLKCGYTNKTINTADPEDMMQYYSRNEQSQYGVIGIEIELLDKNQK